MTHEEPSVPDEVIEIWLSHCDCCRDCGSGPCEGVMAGGMCDQACRCEDAAATIARQQSWTRSAVQE